MNTRFILGLILLLIFARPGFGGPANAPDSQPSGQGAPQITTFALDALAAQPASTRPADWPITSADILAGYRSYNDWPDAERWFMLTHLEQESQKAPAIEAWLHEEHPLQQAQMRFEVQSTLGIGSQGGTVSMPSWNGGSLTDEQLGEIIGSLSPAQRSTLLANTLRLPISDLTATQKAQITPIFKDMPRINGTPVMDYPDAYLFFRFQFSIGTTRQGTAETFQTLISAF